MPAPCAAASVTCFSRPLVGILLNGTSLSTRISPGRPSTRSAMMLRRISSVPPAIRIDGETAASAGTGRAPRLSRHPGEHAGSRPAGPSHRSRCPAASSPPPACRSSFPAPDARPWTAPRSRDSWCISARSFFTAQPASFERVARSSIAGPSSVIRLAQKSNISGKPVASRAPIDIRSFISVVSDTFQPSPTAPSRWLIRDRAHR